MHHWSLISGVLLLVVFIFTVIGTAGPQFNNEVGACNNQFFLYQSRTKCDGSSAVTSRFDRDEFACKGSYDKITTAYAFAIMACITSGVATILAFAAAFVRRIPTWAIIPLVALTFLFLLIAWPISESVRSVRQCDAPSLKDGGFGISWGLALLITAWCLSLLVLVLAAVCHVRPMGHKHGEPDHTRA